MQAIEIVGALTFLAIVGATFLLSLRSLVRRTWVVVDRVSLVAAALGLICIAYGYFIEPYRLTTTPIEIQTSKLRINSRIRIVQLSDLHSDPKPRLEPEIPNVVAALKPDVIVFTGDSINSPDGLPVFQKLLSSLSKIAPTFVVKGNWDASFWAHLPLFEGTGAQELNGKGVRSEIRGTPIWIAGISDGNESSLASMMKSIPESEFSVLLYHRPDLPREDGANHVDLYLAGHTHGGQIALPLYGAIVTLSKFGKRYEAGLFHEQEMWLYVNRGIGMEGGVAPRVRFWSPPEISVFDLVGTASTQ